MFITPIFRQGADLETTANRISKIVSNIDMLRFTYNKHSHTFWLEYGTEPLFRTLEWTQHEPYHIKNDALFFATQKALQLFPHNKPDDSLHTWQEGDELPGPPIPNVWFKASIQLYNSAVRDAWGTYIEIRQSIGDRATYYRIAAMIQAEIQNILWRERQEFISLANGVVSNTKSHIERYVFNELNVREICEFIG
jgi:hypothetical protein